MSSLPTGSMKKLMEEKKLMKPLWIAFPEYCFCSMAWRMGFGESYADSFREWFGQFSEEDRELYRKMFPTPVGWRGWWVDCFEEMDNLNFCNHERLFTGNWNPSGSTKYSADWFNNELNEKKEICVKSLKLVDKEYNFPSPWAYISFSAPLRDPEDYLDSVMDYALNCWYIYTGDIKLNVYCEEVFYEPTKWKDLKENFYNYSDDEWMELFPQILALGYYYQISQHDELVKLVLESNENDVFFFHGEDDLVLGCDLSEDNSVMVGKNLLGFALTNACYEIRRIYKNVQYCESFEN